MEVIYTTLAEFPTRIGWNEMFPLYYRASNNTAGFDELDSLDKEIIFNLGQSAANLATTYTDENCAVFIGRRVLAEQSGVNMDIATAFVANVLQELLAKG